MSIKLIKDQNRSLSIDSAAKALIFSLYGTGVSYEKKKSVYFFLM